MSYKDCKTVGELISRTIEILENNGASTISLKEGVVPVDVNYTIFFSDGIGEDECYGMTMMIQYNPSKEPCYKIKIHVISFDLDDCSREQENLLYRLTNENMLFRDTIVKKNEFINPIIKLINDYELKKDRFVEDINMDNKYPYNNFSIDYKFCPYCGQSKFKELRRDSVYDKQEAVCENCCSIYSRECNFNGTEYEPIITYRRHTSEKELIDIIKRKLDIIPGYSEPTKKEKSTSSIIPKNTPNYNRCISGEMIVDRSIMLINEGRIGFKKIDEPGEHLPKHTNCIVNFVDCIGAVEEVMSLYIHYDPNIPDLSRIKVLGMNFNVIADSSQVEYLKNIAQSQTTYDLFSKNEIFVVSLEKFIKKFEEF